MTKRFEARIESDQLGEVQIPAGAYWGIRTARMKEGGSVSGARVHPRFIEAAALVKKAAALANCEAGGLDAKIARPVAQAADEILSGQWRDQFVIDPFHAVPAHNHNINEVLANRAIEITGGQPGDHTIVDPDLHVSLSQSANDFFPTAMRIAMLNSLRELEPVLLDLERLLRRKSLEFGNIVKPGRTNLQEAAPITLGQEFNAYGATVERCVRRMQDAGRNLLELNLGATEVGTGIGAQVSYVARALDMLTQWTGLPFRPPEDYFRLSLSMADFVEFSSTLKELCVELIKIAGDLRLLNSGPRSGFGEISLPPASPTSSFLLPDVRSGRREPALVDSLSMAAFKVIGNDTTVVLAAQAGQLETNAMMPLILHTILQSLDLLRGALQAFNQRCLPGLRADAQRCKLLLEESLLTAAALVDHIGREDLVSLLGEAQDAGRTLRELLLERRVVAPDTLEKCLAGRDLTQPGPLPGTASDTGSDQSSA